MQELTTIQLTPEEAKLFIQFQKRYLFMQLLESLGVFNVKSGYVTIHFDNLGGIGSVDIQRHYKLPT
jgi:hypothetical protein